MPKASPGGRENGRAKDVSPTMSVRIDEAALPSTISTQLKTSRDQLRSGLAVRVSDLNKEFKPESVRTLKDYVSALTRVQCMLREIEIMAVVGQSRCPALGPLKREVQDSAAELENVLSLGKKILACGIVTSCEPDSCRALSYCNQAKGWVSRHLKPLFERLQLCVEQEFPKVEEVPASSAKPRSRR